jgi:hypothetical protein
MKWCCTHFEEHYNNAGKRGLSVVVGTGVLHPTTFFLQHRSLNVGSKEPTEPFDLILISQTTITFCPWCGHNLQRWYGKSAKELIKEEFILGRSSDSQ